MAAMNKKTASILLYQKGSVLTRAPKKDAGIETTAYGNKSEKRKNPLRENWISAIPATKKLSNNALDRINSVEMPANAMIARYPLAPPCPTLE